MKMSLFEGGACVCGGGDVVVAVPVPERMARMTLLCFCSLVVFSPRESHT